MDQLIDLLRKFEIGYVLDFLKDILTFYLQPIKFFKKLLNKDRVIQAHQIGFYFLINAGILFIIFDIDYKFFLKYFIKDEFTYIVGQSIILSITVLIVSKLYSINISFIDSLGKTLIFLICLNLLTIPIAFSFDRAYTNTQEYEYYLANSFVSLFVSVITLIYSGSIFFEKTKQIIIYNVLLFILINIGQVITSNLSFDNYKSSKDSYYQDEPYTEYRSINKNLSLEESYPVLEISINSKDWNAQYYILKKDMKGWSDNYIPNSAYYINQSQKYVQYIDQQNTKLDSLEKITEFDRNIQYIYLWKKYYNYLKYNSYRNNIDKKYVYSYKYYNHIKRQMREVKVSAIGFEVLELQKSILTYEIQYLNTKRRAEEFNRLFYNAYFYPSSFITNQILSKN